MMKRVCILLTTILLFSCTTAPVPQQSGKTFTGINAVEKHAKSEAAAAEKERQGRCTDARIALARAQESGNHEAKAAATRAINLHCEGP